MTEFNKNEPKTLTCLRAVVSLIAKHLNKSAKLEVSSWVVLVWLWYDMKSPLIYDGKFDFAAKLTGHSPNLSHLSL